MWTVANSGNLVAVVVAERSSSLCAIAQAVTASSAGAWIQAGIDGRAVSMCACTASGEPERGPASRGHLPSSLCRPAISGHSRDDMPVKKAAPGEASVGTTSARSRNSLRISQDVSAISEQLWQAAPCSHLSSSSSSGLC